MSTSMSPGSVRRGQEYGSRKKWQVFWAWTMGGLSVFAVFWFFESFPLFSLTSLLLMVFWWSHTQSQIMTRKLNERFAELSAALNRGLLDLSRITEKNEEALRAELLGLLDELRASNSAQVEASRASIDRRLARIRKHHRDVATAHEAELATIRLETDAILRKIRQAARDGVRRSNQTIQNLRLEFEQALNDFRSQAEASVVESRGLLESRVDAAAKKVEEDIRGLRDIWRTDRAQMEHGFAEALDSISQESSVAFTKVTSSLEELDRRVNQEEIRANKFVESRALRLAQESYVSGSAIAFLSSEIRPVRPLWFTRSYAATPELLAFLYLEILETNPALVLDIGSGMTTVIAGYAMKKNDFGQVFGVEHSKEYAGKTEDLVRNHEVSDRAQVILAPLTPVAIGPTKYNWYDLKKLPQGQIDLLVVDGPPGDSGRHARFPAVEVLRDRLSPTATIILDDVERPDEQEVLDRWLELLPGARVDVLGEYGKSRFAVIRLGRKSQRRFAKSQKHRVRSSGASQ